MTLTLLCATRTSPHAAEKVKVKIVVNGLDWKEFDYHTHCTSPMAVELLRYQNQFSGRDYRYYLGIYRCAIETTAVNGHMGRASVYIGLYNPTGEMHAD